MDTPAAHVPDATARRRNAKILAWKAAGSALVMSVIVCLITWGLEGIHFGPVHDLALFEERILYKLFPPTLKPKPNYHTIVYVEVDQKTTIDWLDKEIAAEAEANKGAAVGASPPKRRISQGTPRSLLATLVRTAHRAGASVIYLDYDFRSPMRGDDALISALSGVAGSPTEPRRPANASPGDASKILVPIFWADDKRQTCNDREVYREFSTILDDIQDRQSNVEFVHPMFSLSGYGIVERVCSEYLSLGSIENPSGVHPPAEFRPAAMRRAVELVNQYAEHSTKPHANDDGYFSIRWRVGPETGILAGEDRKIPLYRKFTATGFLDDVGESKKADTLAGSIIVIGSNHNATADHIDSPLGMIPGALAHVNFAIDLQMSNPEEASFSRQMVFEIIFITLGILAFFRPFIRYLLNHEILPRTSNFWSEVLTSIVEWFLMTILVGLALLAAWLLSPWWPATISFFQVQRFAGIGLCVGFVVVFTVELMRAVAALIEHVVDHLFAVRLHLSPVTTQQRNTDEPSAVGGVAGTAGAVADVPGNRRG